ncbi:hypothetical protein [Nonomuraea basaltis]|uniref:hypothetical protein n=1 Tax=Nonomuraea basaltis TaxID=2495887 RepID=UPI00110C57B7|nr:hypothetical protein [Nonomuraea basaltis]TMR90535.1 hypothetical protein EJK15_54820 [Nonomuraea basaltis]
MIDLLWTAWGVLWDVAAVIGLASITVTAVALLAHSRAVRHADAAQRANEQQWRDFARRGLHAIETPKE